MMSLLLMIDELATLQLSNCVKYFAWSHIKGIHLLTLGYIMAISATKLCESTYYVCMCIEICVTTNTITFCDWISENLATIYTQQTLVDGYLLIGLLAIS